MQWCCQLLQPVTKSRAEFYFVQRFAQQKDCVTTRYTVKFSSNLSRNGIARQVAEKLHSVTGPLLTSGKQSDVTMVFNQPGPIFSTLAQHTCYLTSAQRFSTSHF